MRLDFTEIINGILEENVVFMPGCRKMGSKYNLRCFYCGDSATNLRKKRGWLYLDYIHGHNYSCFNCGRASRGSVLAADMMGIDLGEVRKLIAEKVRKSDITGATDLSESDVVVGGNLADALPTRELEIPIHWDVMNKDCEALVYNRMITDAPFIPPSLKFYYCTNTRRLVIPWSDYGKIQTFQTRAMYKNQEPKYKFESGGNKTVFGLDNIDSSIPYIFTHEGVFDAIFMVNSVACGGIAPNEVQLEMIRNKYPTHKIVYMLDNPWLDKSSRKYIIDLASKKPEQLVYLWNKSNTYKDVNDDVIFNNDINKYADIETVIPSIFSARVAKMALLFNKMP
jgi:hypothetical protein